MGTRFDLLSISELDTQPLFIAKVEQCLEQLEFCFNRFNPESEISLINQVGYIQSTEVSDLLFELLNLSEKYYHLTEGIFNIATGQLTDSYRNGKQLFRQQLKEFPIELDLNGKSVLLKNNKYKIDLGGIAKGFVLDQMEKICDEFQINDVLISFGGSSISARGSHPYGKGWPVSIKSFKDPNMSLHSFVMQNTFLSFSGKNNQNGETLSRNQAYNPLTGELAASNSLICVESISGTLAEVLSTAILVANNDQRNRLIQRKECKTVVEVKIDNDLTENLTYLK